MAYITSLTNEYANSSRLKDIRKRNGLVAKPTDFALLLGARDIHNSSDITNSHYNSSWWSTNKEGHGIIYDYSGNPFSINNINKHYRNCRFIGVRPALYNYSDILNISDDVCEIEYGEYPQYSASIELQKELEHLYTIGELRLTGKEYTIDGALPTSSTIAFIPDRLDEYEYKGKKYVRVMAKSNTMLSNGMDVKYNHDVPQYVWVEVTPIKWLVDKEEDLLLSKNILLAGLRNHKLKRSGLPKGYSGTDYFLYTTFTEEIEPKELPKKKEKTPEMEINNILESIREYKRYYENNIDIEKEITKILQEYNEKLDNLINKPFDKVELVVEPGDNTPEKAHRELLSKLRKILEKVRIYCDKVSDYHTMSDIIEHGIHTDLNFTIDELISFEYLDELSIDIILIRKAIYFITDIEVRNRLRDEFNHIIDENISQINKYIKEFKLDDDLMPKSLVELKLEFRKDLQPFLVILKEKVEKQDLVNEILESTKMEVQQLYTDAKNERVNFMRKELQNAEKRICEIGTNEEIAALVEMLKIEISLDEDINTIFTKFEKLLRTVNAFCLELEAKKRNIDNINRYKYSGDNQNHSK